jgi:hypothetical protein
MPIMVSPRHYSAKLGFSGQFRDIQQLQQPDKPVMPIMVSPRHYSAKLGFSGQFRDILLALIALVLSRDIFREIKQ